MNVYTTHTEPLDETDSPWKFNLGALVYYTDPDYFIASGWYTIIERYEGPGYLLSNGYYNIESKEEDLSI